MIIRARFVITMDGPPIENGAVAISGDRIDDVGKISDISKRYSGQEVIDLGEQALFPGLINTHCHLDYTCLRGKIPRQASFTDWVRAINAEKAKLFPEDYIASIQEGLAEAKGFGTTTIANLTAFPELISRIQPTIRAWWFAELIDVRDPSRAKEMVDAALEKLKSAEYWGLAPHALFSASESLYRRCEEITQSREVLLTTHLAESHEEMSMFRDARGPLYEFLKEMGRDMRDCGDKTPLHRCSEILRDSSTSVGMIEGGMFVHLNELTENDLELLRGSKPNFQIIHCPRSHDYFGHSPFQFKKLRDLRFNICLGTDSLASNNDLSLFAEMRAFQKEFPDVSPKEILKMVTVNGARALRQEKSLGQIRPGCSGDLVAVPVTRSTSAFEEIIACDRAVSWVMINGQVQNSV